MRVSGRPLRYAPIPVSQTDTSKYHQILHNTFGGKHTPFWGEISTKPLPENPDLGGKFRQRDQTVTVQRPTPFQRLNASTPQPNPRALRLLLLCCAHPHSELEDPSCFPPLVKCFVGGVLGASASLPRRLPCLVIQHELLLQFAHLTLAVATNS